MASPAKRAKTGVESIYRVIEGVKYDREVLERAEAAAKSGRASLADAHYLWEEVAEGRKLTALEKMTLTYATANVNFSEKARSFLESRLHPSKPGSFFKSMGKVRGLDRALLEKAEGFAQAGNISQEQAIELWKEAVDGDQIIDCEVRTLQYITETLSVSEAAQTYLDGELQAAQAAEVEAAEPSPATPQKATPKSRPATPKASSPKPSPKPSPAAAPAAAPATVAATPTPNATPAPAASPAAASPAAPKTRISNKSPQVARPEVPKEDEDSLLACTKREKASEEALERSKAAIERLPRLEQEIEKLARGHERAKAAAEKARAAASAAEQAAERAGKEQHMLEQTLQAKKQEAEDLAKEAQRKTELEAALAEARKRRESAEKEAKSTPKKRGRPPKN